MKLLRQCPCKKLIRRATSLLYAHTHTQWISVFRVEKGSRSVSSEDRGRRRVFCERPVSPRHNSSPECVTAEAGPRRQEESGASFHEGMVSRPQGARQGVGREGGWCESRCHRRGGDHDFSLCQITIEICRFHRAEKRKCLNKEKEGKVNGSEVFHLDSLSSYSAADWKMYPWHSL